MHIARINCIYSIGYKEGYVEEYTECIDRRKRGLMEHYIIIVYNV